MAQISLEQAWQQKKQTGQSVGQARDQVAKLTQELGDASDGLAKARDSDLAAESVLESVAARTPPNSVAETSDGTILFAIGGHIYEYSKVPASDVSGDDGGAAPPAPEPTPTPAPEPAPAPAPAPAPDATPTTPTTPPTTPTTPAPLAAAGPSPGPTPDRPATPDQPAMPRGVGGDGAETIPGFAT